MNREAKLVVGAVVDLVVAEGYVAHGNVIEILAVGCFKSRNGDVRVRIELLRNAPGKAVQLHAVELAALHVIRQHSEEVADTHGRLQNVAALKSEICEGVINRLYDSRACVMGIQRGCSCRLIFFRRQCFGKLRILLLPVFLRFVECVCQTAPADITGQDFLLLGRSGSSFGFDLFERMDRVHIRAEFGFRAAFAQMFIRDSEVLRLGIGIVKAERFHYDVERQPGFFCGIGGDLFGVVFVLRIALQQCGKAFLAFRAGNGIDCRRITQMHVEQSDVLYDEGFVVLEINCIADAVGERFAVHGFKHLRRDFPFFLLPQRTFRFVFIGKLNPRFAFRVFRVNAGNDQIKMIPQLFQNRFQPEYRKPAHLHASDAGKLFGRQNEIKRFGNPARVFSVQLVEVADLIKHRAVRMGFLQCVVRRVIRMVCCRLFRFRLLFRRKIAAQPDLRVDPFCDRDP